MYQWKIGGIHNADADKVGNEIASLGDSVTTKKIVNYAKAKDTELHKLIEQIIHFINMGGFSVGIGDWIPEKGGNFGMFHVQTN